MANQNQLRRYYLIYEKVKNHSFPSRKKILKDLDELHDIYIDKRTLIRDIEQIQNYGIEIEYDRKENGYYIAAEEGYSSGSVRFLEIAYLADNLSKENYAKYISYGEADLLKGISNVPKLLEAIDKKRVITFRHHSYQRESINQRSIQPYLLREYLNRWYVIGYKTDTKELRTYGVDRISDLEITKSSFERRPNHNIESLFDHVIGVVFDANQLIKVEFKAPLSQKNYLNSLPLHKSQQHLIDDNDESYFQMEVVHNYELEQKLLMHSAFITVTKPKSLVMALKAIFKGIGERYSTIDKWGIRS
ncbi:hypothetical protein AWW68_11555 [Roseivirga spongicola]|uniref:WYL domain-containing protein n=1 Tax=Roseivirga spongicola TaxID=333140 RepID=A0A150X3N7_9BACT|nr:WYL domain-containing protein [Roseivirga spongicola]KYG73336.1 hypothetical protein AWW68_11555 [Roseivirga spongicola]